MTRGRLFVISGPSGAGKGTVIARLQELCPELVFSVSVTTRAPRPGEVDGVAYHFVSPEKFLEMLENDEFIEHAKYVEEMYATPKKPIDEWVENGKDVLLDIEVQGARQVMDKVSDAVTIFIVPPDMTELERRLRGRRTESEEMLTARLQRACHELKEKVHYDHVIVNDDVSRAAQEILAIIKRSHTQT